jgi:hypothetical protein
MLIRIGSALFVAATAAGVALCLLPATETETGPVIRTGYHLTARPWKPLDIKKEKYLDAVEGVCRFSIRHQDATGAIIDPILKQEVQYATPYFAYAVGALVSAGRAPGLLPNGVKAMDHATAGFAGGRATIPDNHGEFFIAALTEALELYAGHVPPRTLETWRHRMRKPLAEVIRGGKNNWETYAMKGEWLRAESGLADRREAIKAIEDDWRLRQRKRLAPAPWFLYHDLSSEPDTLSVEAVGRGNLLALIDAGYNGPSANEIRRAVESGTRFTLLLQDPSGQVPANGRTDDHVWVDVGYQLAFEVMAERANRQGDAWLAGQFRHAAMLSFQSIERWRRNDAPWAGTYSITKNHFDPALRVGYQLASFYSNYSGSLMFHLAEAWRARATTIPEHPAPAEIGGYALATEPEFSSVFANAGGFQMQANLRGQEAASSGNRWTPLGVVRFARAGWDSRLGPSDGALTETGGVSFAPEFLDREHWVRMADLSSRYEGVWSVQFVHPLLVRCAIDYRPKAGQSGPAFRDEFILTPDGLLSTVKKTSAGASPWAVTWPILENDGSPLERSTSKYVASVHYPQSADLQNFIALDGPPVFTATPPLRGSYGDLRPIRVKTAGDTNHTLVYPQGPGDPDADSVRKSFVLTNGGFRSVLGEVNGTIYTGRTSAGGFGTQISMKGRGAPDAKFSQPCGFLLQVQDGVVTSVEVDHAVQAEIQGRHFTLSPHIPVHIATHSSP